MSKSIVVGSTLAVLGLGGIALGAWQVQDAQRGPEYAQITNVETLTRTVETPREVCRDVVVQQQAPTRDPHSVVGTAAGAIVGGLLGNQVGGGSGKKIATVAGAIGGAWRAVRCSVASKPARRPPPPSGSARRWSIPVRRPRATR